MESDASEQQQQTGRKRKRKTNHCEESNQRARQEEVEFTRVYKCLTSVFFRDTDTCSCPYDDDAAAPPYHHMHVPC